MSKWSYVALIPLALCLSASAAELPCQLTDQDYAALAAPSTPPPVRRKPQLSRDDVQAKPADVQQDICVTRRFVNAINTRGGQLRREDIPDYDPQYVTDEEYRSMQGVISQILIRSLPPVLRPSGTA